MSELTDTGWSYPVNLNEYVSGNLSRSPCISPNGKRLFYSKFINGWDLYYSDWDETTQDWGPSINCGPGVNTLDYSEIDCTLPNDTTLIFLRTNVAYISNWNKLTETWGESSGFPTDLLPTGSDWGIYVTSQMTKIYKEGSYIDSTKEGEFYLNHVITVSYKDSTTPSGYSRPYVLNTSLLADTLYFLGEYEDRWEGFPTLTADGKTLYFSADYHGQITIYETHMIIDENGDSVLTGLNEGSSSVIPETFELYDPYPNPFNPSTKIVYKIKKRSKILLKVYDILGKQAAELINDYKQTGVYDLEFNNYQYNLNSGVYFVVLQADEQKSVKKILLIK